MKVKTKLYPEIVNQDLPQNGYHCGICEHKSSSSEFQVEGIDIEYCNNCGVHFSTYDPQKSQVIYQEDYYSGVDNGYGDYALEIKTHKATFSRRLKFAEEYLPEKGILLDYGCAIGHLCMVSKEMGWKTFGSDFSNFGAETTNTDYGVETFVSDVTHPPIKDNSVDLVCMYDLIEHIPDPGKALRNVSKIIKPEGYVHLVTPDVGSFSRFLLGKNWFHFKPREHLYFFNKKTMTSLLQENGFEVVTVKTSVSYMTIEDIFKRFEKYYGSTINKLVMNLLKLFSIDQLVVPLIVGNLEAFAKPIKDAGSSSLNFDKIEDVKLTDILKCNECDSGSLDNDFTCGSCGAYYKSNQGVPDLKSTVKKAA